MTRLHPLTLLIAAAGAIAWIQLRPLAWMGVCAGLVITAALLIAGPRFLRLLKRTRWLILATALLFLFATPGEHAPSLAGALPAMSYEGMGLAARHTLLLLLFVAVLAVLLETQGTSRLVVALHGLVWPLRYVGLDVDRAALRLLLVLAYLDRPDVAWRQWLLAPASAPVSLPADIVLPSCSAGWGDMLLLCLLVGGFVWW